MESAFKGSSEKGMDWFEKFRSEFPIMEKEIYVDIALINPLPSRVIEAVSAFLKRVQQGENDKKVWHTELLRIRGKIAQLIHAKSNEIAFTKNTAEGLNILSRGLPWKSGDNVVVADQEHPNNVLPWLNLKHLGVEVRIVSAQDYRLPVNLIWSGVDHRTRAIAVSSVQYCSGYRINLLELGGRCHEENIWLFVDGIQGVGTLKTDVHAWGIHALACGGHKALFAPMGIGFLYCEEELLDQLTPAYAGTSPTVRLKRQEDWGIEIVNLRDAQRLEIGTLNYPGIFGLETGLDLLNEAGIERIETRVLILSRRLSSGLRRLGYRVISSENSEEQSGIVGVLVPDPPHFFNFLRASRIRASLMDAGIIRFSFHAHNLEWEVDRILEIAGRYILKTT